MKNLLRELLQEDQEPFRLDNYIADRRKRLLSRRPKSSSDCYDNRRQRSNFGTKLCKKGCFSSSVDSLDVNNSTGSYNSSKNVILLYVPARTAEMLLEASARIRKPCKSDPKRTFGSFLKKLKQSSDGERRRKKNEVGDGVGVRVKDILRRDSSTAFIGRSVKVRENPTFSPAIPAINSDRNLEIFDDLETEFRRSPFRFVLHNATYNNQTTSSYSSSPADSPSRSETEEWDEKEEIVKKGGNEGEREEEEEEEHCSPVSVLDPDFDEEDHTEEGHEGDDDESGSFDMDRSCAIVQRAQQKLLEKLSRFERLAGLDPLELEIRFQEDDDEFSDEEEGEKKCKESESLSDKRALDQLLKQVLERAEFKTPKRVPMELKKVIKIVLKEEEGKLIAFDDNNILLERVVRRLAMWNEAVSEKINVTTGFDITEDVFGWGRKQEKLTDVVMEIELDILGTLVDELCDELAC